MSSPSSISSADPVGSGVGGSLVSGPAEILEDLRRQFGEQHYVRLPGFLGRALFERVTRQLAQAEFEVRTSGVGTEWLMKPNALLAKLNWLLNAPELLRAMGHVTGCDDLGLFAGRVYRMDPSSGQSFSWHDDREHFKDRRLAISINLGERPYAGGVLELRETSARETVAEVPNLGAGDAVLFRIAEGLEHRVTPVEGDVSKLALAGWYRTGPGYYRMLLRRRGSASS